MSERFELLDIEGDISGKLRLIYGSGPATHWQRRRTINAGTSSGGSARVRRTRGGMRGPS
jgi:hypothetical protein